MSAAERAKLLGADQQNQLDILREHYPDAKPGPVSVKRFVSPKDWASTVSRCVNAAGFQSTVGGGGVGWSNIPAEQQEPYAIAYYTCYVEYPIDPADFAPLSKAEMKYLYGYLTGSLSQCLRRHGISLHNPPSEQSFADEYPTSGGWTPYADVTSVAGRKWDQLNRECPQEPKGFRGH